eukprot:CAMPEP_0185196586 /NCGR_PEP_ID=MMETSP1140-20130426/37943_1 /TAXON_ID=298111 /ORGANISM="Pavlova sp., Strain CCMP459" /LENGTH=66 /DNA_ID=CAMNT_0027763635 /DNA_START=190 /DNA_END=386 /DNA_ORIENTATION=+
MYAALALSSSRETCFASPWPEASLDCSAAGAIVAMAPTSRMASTLASGAEGWSSGRAGEQTKAYVR